jgi:phosphoribosyl-ATP pyrophosphohydrolase
MSIENKQEVFESVRAAGEDVDQLREKIRALVMKALVDHQADQAAIREVMRDTLAGVGDGLVDRGSQASGALREAVRGMDEAVGRSVYSLRMAMDEAWGVGQRFAETDVRDTVNAVKDLEDDLLSTIKEASDKTQGWLKGEFADLGVHLSRTGTDTGTQVRDVMEKLNSRMASIAMGTGADAMATAEQARTRLYSVASGILRGLADSLDAKQK